ncbi:hypothetical protein CTheo_6846 [Ceratobasidium theobromae]|uniref:Uncharacterized protein n=1 Tax=Ceratobasidium theobromae TaxID=1582974 RepID=A0A5N5QDM3_9AGAM|nr:hypothetical protein CTheo_6846 [Ceratobasidium theobromae]
MVSMFWTARAVLNAGDVIRRAKEDDSEQAIRDAASQAQKLNFALYDEFDMLVTEGKHFNRNVRDKVSHGLSVSTRAEVVGAKAEDNHKVKHAIVHLKKWEPSLIDEPKDKRGLTHPECAYLLSPITVDWDNEGWKGRQVIPVQGLLRSQLLVDVAEVVLRSPRSVISSARVRPGTVRRGRKGIGANYHLTQVRFALSSEDTFSDDDGGTFNYTDFYAQFCKFLETPKYRSCTKRLLEWWNKELFPDAIRGSDGGANANPPDGMLALLEAEFEEDNSETCDSEVGEGARAGGT